MDAYERVTRALHFQEPDRVPVYQMLSCPGLIDRLGGTGSYLERVARAHQDLAIDCCAFFPGSETDWITDLVQGWGRFLGIDMSGWQVEAAGDTAWISRRPFDDVATLGEHLPDFPDKDLVASSYVDWFIPSRDALAPHTVLFGTVMGCFALSSLYCGPEIFFLAMFQAPDVVERLLDVFTEYALAITTAFARGELGPAFHVADDCAHKTSLLVSPKFLREKQFPRLKRIIAPLKEKGIKVIFHSDGDLRLILDGLVNEVGIDGLHPIEPVPGMDIVELRRRYPRLILCGNLDYVNILNSGQPAAVAAEVERLVRTLGPGGGYLFGASSDITDFVPLGNVLAMSAAVQEIGRYPIEPADPRE